MYHRFRISSFFSIVKSSKEDNLVTGEVDDGKSETKMQLHPHSILLLWFLFHGLDLKFHLEA